MYIFLDCSRELATFRSFLAASLLIGLIGIGLVFLLLVFLSGLAVRPFAESYAKQKRFITDAGHELKTPLTIIQANAEVMELEGGENEWTASIRNQVGRLNKLTDQLVFLARMDEEEKRLDMTDFSISDAIAEAAQPYRAVAMAQGKRLTAEVEKAVSFHGNEAAIRQLVSLLLDNAMKYSPEGTEVCLRFGVNGKRRELTVSNAVEDMESGRLDYLFDRFYRADASRNSETGGHGIGLSVAKAIVTVHKGKITAQSADGKSIVFTVLL